MIISSLIRWPNSPYHYKDQVEDMAEGYTRENGDFEEEIDGVYVEIEAAVCSACGSDYTRDDDGTIIDG